MVPKDGFLRLLVLFLGFSLVLSSVAVPTTRSLKSTEGAYQLVQDFQAQDATDLFGDKREMLDVGLGYIIRRRMVTDTTNDYPGTGANPHHDPKTPGAH